MYRYAVINWENKCVDIIDVEDIHTLDGYELPEGPCALVATDNWENEAGVGLYFDGLTNTFQSEPIVVEEEPLLDPNNIPQ